MYYAAPYSEEDYGRIIVYIRKPTIKEIGEHFKKHADDPQQEFIVYRGRPANVKNYHAHYYFNEFGNFVKKPMLLEQLLSDVFS